LSYSPEHAFEDRLRRRFGWAGYVCIKCATSRPFDLIVMKDGYVAALELKPLGKKIKEDQRSMQVDLAKLAGIDLILLMQLQKGKVKAFNLLDDLLSEEAYSMLRAVLGEFLLQ
jgi:hypothetical protein